MRSSGRDCSGLCLIRIAISDITLLLALKVEIFLSARKALMTFLVY